MNLQKQVGRAIRMYREHLLLVTQEAFADRIGMHRSYYWACESGRKNLQLSTLQRIAAGLGMPLSSLIKMAERLPAKDAGQ